MMSRRVLFIDDEQNVLDAFRRTLRNRFDLDTATSAAAALEKISSSGPYAVVVSDMHMPGMDGIAFLSKLKERAPATIRIMLTGCAQLDVAIDAVNTGNVFRFLTKPCAPETLERAVEDALRQHELIHAERVLLDETLRGSVKVLSEVLSLANPVAFGRAGRMHRLVHAMARELRIENAWQCELAALLSQIGCIAIPQMTLEKAYRGAPPLSPAEQKLLDAHPSLGRTLLSQIPRLEAVAEMVGRQFCEQASPSIGAQLLRIADEFDRLEQQSIGVVDAVTRLRQRAHSYGPHVLGALEAVLKVPDYYKAETVPVQGLRRGMILAEDVHTTDGALLVAKGQEVTLIMLQRLANFASNGRLTGVIQVLAPLPGKSSKPVATSPEPLPARSAVSPTK